VLVCASRVISGACCSATICTAARALRAAVNARSASSRRTTSCGNAQCPSVRATRLIAWSRAEVAVSSAGSAGVAVVMTPGCGVPADPGGLDPGSGHGEGFLTRTGGGVGPQQDLGERE